MENINEKMSPNWEKYLSPEQWAKIKRGQLLEEIYLKQNHGCDSPILSKEKCIQAMEDFADAVAKLSTGRFSQ